MGKLMEDSVFVPGAKVDHAVPILCLPKRMAAWNVVFAFRVVVNVHAL
jgi:hypothetical protein